MQAQLIVILRDILCANLSLDDGLSAVQNVSFTDSDESNILFDIARSIEEIILRRPGLASAKLTELAVRMSFHNEPVIPEMLLLLDTRYTSSHRRLECEISPDIEAIPTLLDILGELSQALSSAIRLNLRSLLPFLADEVLMILNAIFDRRHEGATNLALYEVRSLASTFIDVGFYEGAELLLNRLIETSNELQMEDFSFDVSFVYACVLTELSLYEQSRSILKELEMQARKRGDQVQLAEVSLQLGVNDTRDDSVAHESARETCDKAAELYDLAYKSGLVSVDEVGLAHETIGSSILVNGWREGLPQAIDRLHLALRIFEGIEDKTPQQMSHFSKILVGLGFAHGLLADHENMTKCLEYLNNAKAVLHDLKQFSSDIDIELASTENAIGWICLGTECDEFWPIGLDAFEHAVGLREGLFEMRRISELELLGTRMGLALSQVRTAERTDEETHDPIRKILAQYIPLFPIDQRALIEIAIATYDVVWLNSRHGGEIPPRLMRLLDDIDRILEDTEIEENSMFVNGVSLVVPYVEKSWSVLLERSKRMSQSDSALSGVAGLCAALAISKMNQGALSLEVSRRVQLPVDDAVIKTDALLAQYWMGQTYLVHTIRAFFENKDYSELASGFYGSAIAFG
ncbi:MAG: hypothetical protein ACFFCP_09125, partial [Promethearchaeota archaeon]